jgi:hypothetical protein
MRRATARIRQRPQSGPEIPFARESDPDREFCEGGADGVVWFLGSLLVFATIFVIWTKLGAF